jgi:uncharacterized protein
MSLDDLLGCFATLVIRRFGPPGAFLGIPGPEESPGAESILLVGSETPPGAAVGDELRVFVHRDSEGRPIATTREAKLSLGQVAFLEVTACTDFGSFVDWGLAKELLVPFAEQTVEMRVGARHPIGLYRDKSGRLAGTMRVTEMLGVRPAKLRLDEWVPGEAWRKDPDVGLFVIVERELVGLVPSEEPHRLARGEAASFRVTHLQPDGKIELSLRGHAHEELESDAQTVLGVLARAGAPRVGDASSPDEIRAVFGLSKKAFKRAVGRLLKTRAVTVDGEGFLVPSVAGQ